MWLIQAGSVLPASQVEARPLPKRHQKGKNSEKWHFLGALGFAGVWPSRPSVPLPLP